MPARILCCVLLCPGLALWAAGPKDNNPDDVRRVPRLGIEVEQEQQLVLLGQLKQLEEQIKQLRAKKDSRIDELLPDVIIFHRAASDALAHQEFFKSNEVNAAIQLLKAGEQRAIDLMEGRAPWTKQTGLVVRGFVSQLDGSVQPYGLVVPESYSAQTAGRYRLDVWFHGRGETLSEVNFLTQRQKQVGQFAPRDTIVLHPYGRYSNAFKFAGEVDVLEGIESVQKRYRVDDDRISVRGFSMGGAACWQFAVHYSDRWFVANPGAGFSETPEFLKYFQKEDLNPTWFEKKLWRMYDCNRYARNLIHCPTVAYSGENDIQKQAADVMETALGEHGIQLVHIIGPKTGHRYHPQAKLEVERRLDSLAVPGRHRIPRHVSWTTYTLKYNRCHWVTIDSLGTHWEEANVEAQMKNPEEISIKTKNITALTIDFPSGHAPLSVTKPIRVTIDGTDMASTRVLSDRSFRASFHREDNRWKPGARKTDGLRKRHDLQGPIDDALMSSFLFVAGTGKSANKKVDRWSRSELERAVEHWRRHFRGHARVKNDKDVTDDDIAKHNLILWGDPQSNSVIGKIADKLPIRWTKTSISLPGREHPANNHALVAVYPNPLNSQRYVVLNSSFTYRDYAYLNNARQVPMLPDWAIVDVDTPANSRWPGKIVDANFFDEAWQLK